jgi:predicted RNase H-like nuclease (RuvC/YqgF family)
LVKCPKCGNEVANPIKTWPVLLKKTQKIGEEPKVVMAIFECLSCKTRFRSTLGVETKIEETVSIKNMVERIRGIQGELMQTLKNLREKIKALETERANLIVEIEKLKKAAESRVNALESEVNMLREEVKSLRDLLGYKEEAEK